MLPFSFILFLLLNNRDVRAIANEYILTYLLTYLLADTQWLMYINVEKLMAKERNRKKNCILYWMQKINCEKM